MPPIGRGIIKQKLHSLPKKFRRVACNDFDKHKPILVIFGVDVARKVSNKKWFIFPPRLTSASALPCETLKRKIARFTRMLYCCTARLQPVVDLIYSVLLLATHTKIIRIGSGMSELRRATRVNFSGTQCRSGRHSQADGQPKHIMFPAPTTGWTKA